MVNALQRINTTKYALGTLDVINDLAVENFSALFTFLEMNQRVPKPYTDADGKFMPSEYVNRKYLNIKQDGEFVNFVDEYLQLSGKDHLKEIWKLSRKFSDSGPRTMVYLYENADVIKFENKTNRLILSILFVMLDYNITFPDERTIIAD